MLIASAHAVEAETILSIHVSGETLTLTLSDINRAEAAFDLDNLPVIALRLNTEAKTRLFQFSSSHLGEKAVMAMCDLKTPEILISSPIEGGGIYFPVKDIGAAMGGAAILRGESDCTGAKS